MTLLRLEEARERMLAFVQPLPAESIALEACLGRVLAESVSARLTLPPWDNSAMDGFAVRAADCAGASVEVPVTLRVTGEVAAGHVAAIPVGAGTAVRVLTGGMMPPGADSVVPVEDTDAPAGVAAAPAHVAVHVAPAPGVHVRRVGSDLREGHALLDAGIVLGPAALAVAAAGGHAQLCVVARPRVAVLATGDELAPVGEPPGPAQIPDSNTVLLCAQAAAAGAEVRSLGIARDDLDDVLRRLREGIAWADVVVVSGGVSVGAHDVVKDAFAEIGRLELWRVAIQPGKPLAFGPAARPDGRLALLFGLPGNPVSSFVTFELFVRPVLRRMSGHQDIIGRATVRARLAEAAASAQDRRTFVRVRLEPDPSLPEGWIARLAGGQGSHVLSALAQANGLAIVPEDVLEAPAGSIVDVLRLDEGCG